VQAPIRSQLSSLLCFSFAFKMPVDICSSLLVDFRCQLLFHTILGTMILVQSACQLNGEENPEITGRNIRNKSTKT
jgi:hypothetical protein